jgi:hypothetical protein
MRIHHWFFGTAMLLASAPSLANAQEERVERQEHERTIRGPDGRVIRREETRSVRRHTYRNRSERWRVRGREEHAVTRPERYRRYVVRREHELDVYRRPYLRARHYRTYGVRYGLIEPLRSHPNLGFLSDGLLVASYVDDATGETVYVYLLDEYDVRREYFVRADGAIIGSRVVP